MIAGYLVALGQFYLVAFVLVTVVLCWLALWLLEKGGWRHWCGWGLLAGLVLNSISMIWA